MTTCLMKHETFGVICMASQENRHWIRYVPIYTPLSNRISVHFQLKAFHFHVLRSLRQIALYKQVHVCNPALLTPDHYGRYLDSDGTLVPLMKRKVSKPPAATLTFCKCKKGCIKNCSCSKARLGCIIAYISNRDSQNCGRLTESDDDGN